MKTLSHQNMKKDDKNMISMLTKCIINRRTFNFLVTYTFVSIFLLLNVSHILQQQKDTENNEKTGSEVELLNVSHIVQQKLKVPSNAENDEKTGNVVDVFDIGSSKGQGSMSFLYNALKNQFKSRRKFDLLNPRVLGLDNDPEKVETCKKSVAHIKNLDCIEQDVLELSDERMKEISSSSKVKGVTVWHVMEHMPDFHLAKEIWQKISNVAQNFISFHGPVFDDEVTLNQAGFLRYYENWTGHPCHFNSTMLKESMDESSKSKPFTAHIILIHKPIRSSRSNVILPIGSAIDSHHYNSLIHPPKKSINFNTTYYEEMRACVIYDDLNNIHIYSALCLKDAFLAKNRPKVISCYVIGKILSNQECINYLKDRSNQVIKANIQ